jgi:hypothetical protein
MSDRPLERDVQLFPAIRISTVNGPEWSGTLIRLFGHFVRPVGFRPIFLEGSAGGLGLFGTSLYQPLMTPMGSEQVRETPEKAEPRQMGGAKSGAVSADDPEPRLLAVVAAWSDLPEVIKAAILGLVNAGAVRPGPLPPPASRAGGRA